MSIGRRVFFSLLLVLPAMLVLVAACDDPKQPARPGNFRDPHFTTEFGDWESFKAALAKNPSLAAETDSYGRTPLHYAARRFPPEAIEYLVTHGAEIGARDDGGETPLHAAASTGSLAAVKTLIRLGADPKARGMHPILEKPTGRTVLSTAAQQGHLEIVKFLLEQGVPVEYGEDLFRDTALHAAVRGIISYHRDPEPPHRDFKPRWLSNAAVIDLLAERTGKINVRDGRGETPLHKAAAIGAVESVRHLLENYPDVAVNARDNDGETSLHEAVDPEAFNLSPESRPAIVRLLLEQGADPNIRNDDGETPLDLARQLDEPVILNAFESAPIEAPKP